MKTHTRMANIFIEKRGYVEGGVKTDMFYHSMYNELLEAKKVKDKGEKPSFPIFYNNVVNSNREYLSTCNVPVSTFFNHFKNCINNPIMVFRKPLRIMINSGKFKLFWSGGPLPTASIDYIINMGCRFWWRVVRIKGKHPETYLEIVKFPPNKTLWGEEWKPSSPFPFPAELEANRQKEIARLKRVKKITRDAVTYY